MLEDPAIDRVQMWTAPAAITAPVQALATARGVRWRERTSPAGRLGGPSPRAQPCEPEELIDCEKQVARTRFGYCRATRTLNERPSIVGGKDGQYQKQDGGGPSRLRCFKSRAAARATASPIPAIAAPAQTAPSRLLPASTIRPSADSAKLRRVAATEHPCSGRCPP